jgi:uncharacterized phiE125 gp8 family phage protein
MGSIFMGSILLTGPTAEPLSLDEAKIFLRVEHNADDVLIAALIAAARLHVEAQTQAALITQTWRLTLSDWPCQGQVRVRPAPLQALVAARVFDMQGDAQSLDTQAFVPDAGAATLSFIPWALPSPNRIAAGIELDVTVGFGDSASDVPEPLRQAIRLLVAHWYENRGLVAGDGQGAVLPATVAALIAPYRVLAL